MQIKREIATLKILKHPNVARLHELNQLEVNSSKDQILQTLFWLSICATLYMNFLLLFLLMTLLRLQEFLKWLMKKGQTRARYNKERKLRTSMSVPCHMPSLTKYISFKGDKTCRLIGLGNGSNMFGLTRVTF
ncbi:putative non-specific serine/threonine protein kinase [Helianthus anomalus]